MIRCWRDWCQLFLIQRCLRRDRFSGNSGGGWLMPTPILATKLYIPPLRPEVVSRPRLLERLNEGLRRHLVLISAPAGFGKTTLVSQWLALIERPPAWVSLDEGDNGPARFLTHLVAALQTIAAHVWEGGLGVR